MDSVAAERAELERALERVNSELRDVRERLRDSAFLAKAKPALVDEQRRLRDQLEERQGHIKANLKAVAERQPGGLPSPQVGTWSPLPMHEWQFAGAPTSQPTEPRSAAAPPAPVAALLETTKPPLSSEEISREIAAAVLQDFWRSETFKRLDALVPQAANHLPSLRLLAAAYEGFDAGARSQLVRIEIERLTGVAELPHLLPDGASPITPLTPMPEADELPDARDGLRRDERRLLSAMYALGFRADRPLKKTDAIVEELRLGDPSITAEKIAATLAHLTGPGSRLNPLVVVDDGSCRLTPLGEELFLELDENAFDCEPGFAFKMPSVLPSRVPLLLAKGTDGVPPCELSDVARLVHLRLDDPHAELRYDHPTNAILPAEMHRAGRGVVYVRAGVFLEVEHRALRARLIVRDFPWPLKMADAIEAIRKVPAVTAVHEEPGRLVVELEHAAYARITLAHLQRLPVLAHGFDVELRINENGRAVVAPAKRVLDQFLEHRRDTLRRAQQIRLKKLSDRAEVIEGLLVANEVIAAVNGITINGDDAVDQLWGLTHLCALELTSRRSFAGQTILDSKVLYGASRSLHEALKISEARHVAVPAHGYDSGFSEMQARAILSSRKLTSFAREGLLREWEKLVTEIANARLKLEKQEDLDEQIRRELLALRVGRTQK